VERAHAQKALVVAEPKGANSMSWPNEPQEDAVGKVTSDVNEGSIESDIVEYIRQTFPCEAVEYTLARLASASAVPRIQRCIAFASRGHTWYFDYLCNLAQVDYRDVICAAEYSRLDIRLYDFNRPIPLAQWSEPDETHRTGQTQ
jgi:hypothetical protein